MLLRITSLLISAIFCLGIPLAESFTTCSENLSQLYAPPDSGFSPGEGYVYTSFHQGGFAYVNVAQDLITQKLVTHHRPKGKKSILAFEYEVKVQQALHAEGEVDFAPAGLKKIVLSNGETVWEREYIPGIPLNKYLSEMSHRYSYEEKILLFVDALDDCLNTVMSLHERGFTHNELNLGNFIVVNKQQATRPLASIVLIDLSSSTQKNIQTQQLIMHPDTLIFNHRYIAPELKDLIIPNEDNYDPITALKFYERFSPSTDFYSLAKIFLVSLEKNFNPGPRVGFWKWSSERKAWQKRVNIYNRVKSLLEHELGNPNIEQRALNPMHSIQRLRDDFFILF